MYNVVAQLIMIIYMSTCTSTKKCAYYTLFTVGTYFGYEKENQELENFKFVFDSKIKELRRQMEPRENEIKSTKYHIGKL